MPAPKRIHNFYATSADARISKDLPRIARVNFMLVNGEFAVVEIPRHVLERLIVRGRRALDGAPLPPRGRSSGGHSATSQNK
jgi:hypothetical protein